MAAARSVRAGRARWRERYHLNKLSLELKSRNLRRELDDVSSRFDLVVQVFGLVAPHPWPYVIYADHTWRMAAAGWPAWLPSRAAEHDYWYEAERRMYGAARHVFTMGREVADSLTTSYGVPEERVTVVGGGVNFETLPVLREEPRAEPVILFVGRDSDRKGVDVLLSAFRLVRRRIPNARLRLAGLPPGSEGPGVEFLGVVTDRERLLRAYDEALVFCLPSRYEPYGLVLLEAMAHGLPCVGTAVGAIPEIVLDDETGLVIPPEDPDQLASALIDMLEHPDRAASLGAAGRRRVERELTWDRVVDRMAAGLALESSAEAGRAPHRS